MLDFGCPKPLEGVSLEDVGRGRLLSLGGIFVVLGLDAHYLLEV